MMAHEPYCLAMVLCDGIHFDPGTRKFTLLGTFSGFAAHEFPAQIKLAVYIAISDGLGPVKLQIRLVDARFNLADDPQVVFQIESEVNFTDPLMVVENVVQIITRLPDEGVYYCELLADGTPLMSRRIIAKRIPKMEEQKGG